VPSPASPVHADNAFGVCTPRASVVLQVNDASSKADGHGLRAILRTELVHDVPDMNFDSLFRDRESFADVAVAVTFGNPF
jgi:hypothetical protein